VKTGRTPKEKRIVKDNNTKDTIQWGDINIPISQKGFLRNKARAIDFFNIVPRVSKQLLILTF